MYFFSHLLENFPYKNFSILCIYVTIYYSQNQRNNIRSKFRSKSIFKNRTKSTKDPIKATFKPPFRTFLRISRGGNSLYRATIFLKRIFPVGGRLESFPEISFSPLWAVIRWNGWPRLFLNASNIARISKEYRECDARVVFVAFRLVIRG